MSTRATTFYPFIDISLQKNLLTLLPNLVSYSKSATLKNFTMFELHITCTKDIDKIQIDFSDGSVCTSKRADRADSKDLVEPPKPSKPVEPVEPKINKPKKSVDKVNSRDIIQTYDDGDSEVTGVVVKPSVPDAPTEPKVEDYLQELNF